MGGRRIDDHDFWAGDASEDSPCPMESKMKRIDNVDGSGELKKYEDSQKDIRDMQRLSVKKAEDHEMEHEYRY